MDDRSSLGKVSSSTESVATVTSEEFVLVQSSASGSPQGSESKPRLKVRTTYSRLCGTVFTVYCLNHSGRIYGIDYPIANAYR